MFRRHGWNSRRDDRLPKLRWWRDEGLVLTSGGVDLPISWQAVQTVAFFKVDSRTREVVSTCIEFDDRGVTRRLFVDEEMDLFQPFAEALTRHLPAFRMDWKEKFQRPTTAEYYYVAFNRTLRA